MGGRQTEQCKTTLDHVNIFYQENEFKKIVYQQTVCSLWSARGYAETGLDFFMSAAPLWTNTHCITKFRNLLWMLLVPLNLSYS